LMIVEIFMKVLVSCLHFKKIRPLSKVTGLPYVHIEYQIV
jgi:hypothetical protein